jgi:hypothetical protein
LLLVSVAAVHAQDVAVDFDRSVDFSRFKTYSWANGIPANNPLIDRQIRASIEEQLAAKGLRPVETGGDLNVLYFAAVDSELAVSTGMWETTKDWTRQATSGVRIKSQMWDVEFGTLAVCLSDAANKNLLWRATSKTMLDKKSSKKNVMEAMTEDARRVEKKIKKAVGKMFKQYPPATSAS